VRFAYHDGEEVGPKILSRIAKETGLRPEDL
jgi:predicted RNA binding protein YcfA (HicA-like mRNA interferase family)